MIDSLLMLIAVGLLLISAALMPIDLKFEEPETDAFEPEEEFTGEELQVAA